MRGATCALGYVAIQLAKALGCIVVGTTHRESKMELLKVNFYYGAPLVLFVAYDRTDVFESIVEKVIVGGYDEQGNVARITP